MAAYRCNAFPTTAIILIPFLNHILLCTFLTVYYCHQQLDFNTMVLWIVWPCMHLRYFLFYLFEIPIPYMKDKLLLHMAKAMIFFFFLNSKFKIHDAYFSKMKDRASQWGHGHFEADSYIDNTNHCCLHKFKKRKVNIKFSFFLCATRTLKMSCTLLFSPSISTFFFV